MSVGHTYQPPLADSWSQYIFPVLEGVSIFCLARQDSMMFTNLFGGAAANEGLGFRRSFFSFYLLANFSDILPLFHN
jgi:hypothetical protein